MTRIFFCGTLRSDVPNSKFPQFLAGDAEFVSNAKVHGKLYDLGEYPGLILGAEGWVIGQVFSIVNPAEVMVRLDEYEGADFKRVEAKVLLDTGEWIDSWMYVFGGSVDGKRAIASGDFNNKGMGA
jgi:gamma-glutamylcyclotransferase (GGCT)/AIG2-like uncharacterized protein YtfP